MSLDWLNDSLGDELTDYGLRLSNASQTLSLPLIGAYDVNALLDDDSVVNFSGTDTLVIDGSIERHIREISGVDSQGSIFVDLNQESGSDAPELIQNKNGTTNGTFEQTYGELRFTVAGPNADLLTLSALPSASAARSFEGNVVAEFTGLDTNTSSRTFLNNFNARLLSFVAAEGLAFNALGPAQAGIATSQVFCYSSRVYAKGLTISVVLGNDSELYRCFLRSVGRQQNSDFDINVRECVGTVGAVGPDVTLNLFDALLLNRIVIGNSSTRTIANVSNSISISSDFQLGQNVSTYEAIGVRMNVDNSVIRQASIGNHQGANNTFGLDATPFISDIDNFDFTIDQAFAEANLIGKGVNGSDIASWLYTAEDVDQPPIAQDIAFIERTVFAVNETITLPLNIGIEEKLSFAPGIEITAPLPIAWVEHIPFSTNLMLRALNQLTLDERIVFAVNETIALPLNIGIEERLLFAPGIEITAPLPIASVEHIPFSTNVMLRALNQLTLDERIIFAANETIALPLNIGIEERLSFVPGIELADPQPIVLAERILFSTNLLLRALNQLTLVERIVFAVNETITLPLNIGVEERLSFVPGIELADPQLISSTENTHFNSILTLQAINELTLIESNRFTSRVNLSDALHVVLTETIVFSESALIPINTNIDSRPALFFFSEKATLKFISTGVVCDIRHNYMQETIYQNDNHISVITSFDTDQITEVIYEIRSLSGDLLFNARLNDGITLNGNQIIIDISGINYSGTVKHECRVFRGSTRSQTEVDAHITITPTTIPRG
jgi:hypothetical protein